MWTKGIQQETKKAFEDVNNSSLKNLKVVCMKNWENKFAIITLQQIETGNIKLVDRDEGKSYNYDTVDDMINAGWVVD